MTDPQIEAACNAYDNFALTGDGDPHRHAMRAALEAAEAVAWQPIAEAPKDGTVVDVWLGDAEPADVDFYCTPGTRRAPAWHWLRGKWRPALGLNVMTVFVHPTHYRNLLEPPK